MKELAVKEYKKILVETFSEGKEVIGFKEKNKNQAMWELLNHRHIMPISPTLWMATYAARKEFGVI